MFNQYFLHLFLIMLLHLIYILLDIVKINNLM